MVRLKKGGATVAETTTDAFGDFTFDRLDPDDMTYEIEIAADGFAPSVHEVAVDDSVSLGDIGLSSVRS